MKKFILPILLLSLTACKQQPKARQRHSLLMISKPLNLRPAMPLSIKMMIYYWVTLR